MSDDLTPTRLPDGASTSIHFSFDDRVLSARLGDTIAAALIASGTNTTRLTAVSGTERGPFCMMGVCFDCLVEVNGVANRQACMVTVTDQMQVRTMHGARELATADTA